MPSILWQCALVGCGGAVGAVIRFLATRGLAWLCPGYVGLGTITVNLIGSFAIGLALGQSQSRELISEEWRLLLVPGILGGLTTFSALSYETWTYWSHSSTPWLAWLHLAGNILLGLFAVGCGEACQRWMSPSVSMEP